MRIELVGSTAVARLAAKPILDIVVALPSMSGAAEAARVLGSVCWRSHVLFPDVPRADPGLADSTPC